MIQRPSYSKIFLRCLQFAICIVSSSSYIIFQLNLNTDISDSTNTESSAPESEGTAQPASGNGIYSPLPLNLYRGLPKDCTPNSAKQEIADANIGQSDKSAFTRVESRKEAMQRRYELMKLMESNQGILHSLMDKN